MNGKVAVVIGGHGHLGSMLSKALFDAGAEVVILDKHNCDVTQKAELEAHYDKIMKQYGRNDVLINMAGVNAPTPFFEIDADDINQILEVHVNALIYACQVFGAHMVDERRGSIINFASSNASSFVSCSIVVSSSNGFSPSLSRIVAANPDTLSMWIWNPL